ncbi:hypothetical protein SUGI_0430350 [Cryptomeria japonica]|nr:hypothetical protein SUGI_0430350 [Cryptomeria japonica]
MGFHRVSLALASIFLVQTVSGNFNYQSFSEKNVSLFMFDHSVIDLGSLQVTAETRNRRSPNSPKNRSGRVIFNQKYRLWKEPDSPASFNSTFVFNIAPDMGTGEGMAFIISSNKDIGSGPVGSYGRWLGLFNSTINGLKSNKVVAVEFDTIKSEGTNDPDDNHVAIDVNSINSTKIASLDVGHINLTNEDQNITAWIQYSGTQRLLKVYIAKTPDPMPSQPILQHPLNLSKILDPFVYFGFTASTGEGTELNCVHSWSLSIQDLESSKPNTGLKIGLLVSGMALAVLLATVIVIVYIKHRKYQAEEAIISDTLRKLPGQPHEFKYKTLQKATQTAECRLPLPPPADTPATVNQDDITCLFMVGLACSHPNPQERPTMRQVKQILCRERPLPSVPTYRPPFVWLHSDYEDSSLTGSSFGTSRESVSNLFVRA